MSIRLFRMYVKVPVVLLALIEAALLVFAPYLAGALRFDGSIPDWATPSTNLLYTAVLFAVFGLVSLFAVGLYSTRQRTNAAGILVRVLAAISAAVVLSALVYFFFPTLAMGRGLLALTAATTRTEMPAVFVR